MKVIKLTVLTYFILEFYRVHTYICTYNYHLFDPNSRGRYVWYHLSSDFSVVDMIIYISRFIELLSSRVVVI